MPLATYTAALIANTSVPVWHEGRRELPFAFAGGSAMAAGGAAALLAGDEAGPGRRLAIIGAVTEVVAMEYSQRSMGMVAEPYRTGLAGKLDKGTMACAGGGAALLLAAETTHNRGLGRLGSALVLAGSMLGRWTVFKAGFQSAAAPQYTVQPQRARLGQGAPDQP
jgi:hypothetical protein